MRKAREGIEQSNVYPEPWFITHRWWLRIAYRGLLGRPMDGLRWSDSTFWRSATRGEDHGWLRLAGWQRAAVRVGALYALLCLTPSSLLLYVSKGITAVAQLIAAHVGLWGMLLLPVLLYRLLRRKGLVLPWPERHVDAERGQVWSWSMRTVLHGRQEWLEQKVLPVARTAAMVLNRRYHPAEAEQWVSVPRSYREPGNAVEVLLPASGTVLTDASRRKLALAIGERLGMRDPQWRYELEGNAPRLLLTAPELPPPFVSYADMLPHLERAEEYTLVLGLTGKEALSASLKEDSPHIALSAGSGAGKSEEIKTLAAQFAHWGWFLLILDWKGESQEWLEGLPGVRYVRGIEALHDACVSIGEEVDWRTEHRAPEHKAVRRKMLVVSEEWGITAPLLAAYWSNLRSMADPEERRTMPIKSPATEGLMKLNFTGRSLGMTQLLVAQRFSARVTNGNADLRESFSLILMSRWKSQTAKMLAPDIRPFPKKLTKPGQWLAVIGDDAVRFQGGLWTDEEARAWATSGVQPPASPWSERYEGPVGQHSNVGTLQPPSLGELLPHGAAEGNEITSPMPSLRLQKLSEIVSGVEHLGVTEKVLRNWRDNEPDFPMVRGGTQFAGYLYDLSEVVDYARRKRAAQAAEKAGRQ